MNASLLVIMPIVEQYDKGQERMISIMKLNDIESQFGLTAADQCWCVSQSGIPLSLSPTTQDSAVTKAGYFRKFPGLSLTPGLR